MYNNEITYDKKWDTEENRKAFKELEKKYFNKSICSPSCPLSWAVEVLDLMSHLDDEFGFKHNTTTIRAYRVNGNFFEWFIVSPLRSIFIESFEYLFKPKKYHEKIFLKRLIGLPKRTFSGFIGAFKYGFKAFGPKYLNKYRNKYSKNRIVLDQIKEKFGMLNIYFSSDPAYEEYIDKEIIKCEIKLAMKGAYYPVESMYNSKICYNVGTKQSPDVVTTSTNKDGSINFEKTTHREVMRELGLDLEEVARLAEKRNKKE
jgi:hypothetical protein